MKSLVKAKKIHRSNIDNNVKTRDLCTAARGKTHNMQDFITRNNHKSPEVMKRLVSTALVT